MDGDVPRASSYGVNISQLIWFARVSNPLADANACNKTLTAKLLQQGYHKLRKAFDKFYHRHYELVSKYDTGLNTLLLQGLSDPEFFCYFVYKFRKIEGKPEFSDHFNIIVICNISETGIALVS